MNQGKKKLSKSTVVLLAVVAVTGFLVLSGEYAITGYAASDLPDYKITSASFAGKCSDSSEDAGKIEVAVQNDGEANYFYLWAACEQPYEPAKKQLLLLTDGQVKNREIIITAQGSERPEAKCTVYLTGDVHITKEVSICSGTTTGTGTGSGTTTPALDTEIISITLPDCNDEKKTVEDAVFKTTSQEDLNLIDGSCDSPYSLNTDDAAPYYINSEQDLNVSITVADDFEGDELPQVDCEIMFTSSLDTSKSYTKEFRICPPEPVVPEPEPLISSISQPVCEINAEVLPDDYFGIDCSEIDNSVDCSASPAFCRWDTDTQSCSKQSTVIYKIGKVKTSFKNNGTMDDDFKVEVYCNPPYFLDNFTDYNPISSTLSDLKAYGSEEIREFDVLALGGSKVPATDCYITMKSVSTGEEDKEEFKSCIPESEPQELEEPTTVEISSVVNPSCTSEKNTLSAGYHLTTPLNVNIKNNGDETAKVKVNVTCEPSGEYTFQVKRLFPSLFNLGIEPGAEKSEEIEVDAETSLGVQSECTIKVFDADENELDAEDFTICVEGAPVGGAGSGGILPGYMKVINPPECTSKARLGTMDVLVENIGEGYGLFVLVSKCSEQYKAVQTNRFELLPGEEHTAEIPILAEGTERPEANCTVTLYDITEGEELYIEDYNRTICPGGLDFLPEIIDVDAPLCYQKGASYVVATVKNHGSKDVEVEAALICDEKYMESVSETVVLPAGEAKPIVLIAEDKKDAEALTGPHIGCTFYIQDSEEQNRKVERTFSACPTWPKGCRTGTQYCYEDKIYECDKDYALKPTTSGAYGTIVQDCSAGNCMYDASGKPYCPEEAPEDVEPLQISGLAETVCNKENARIAFTITNPWTSRVYAKYTLDCPALSYSDIVDSEPIAVSPSESETRILSLDKTASKDERLSAACKLIFNYGATEEVSAGSVSEEITVCESMSKCKPDAAFCHPSSEQGTEYAWGTEYFSNQKCTCNSDGSGYTCEQCPCEVKVGIGYCTDTYAERTAKTSGVHDLPRCSTDKMDSITLTSSPEDIIMPKLTLILHRTKNRDEVTACIDGTDFKVKLNDKLVMTVDDDNLPEKQGCPQDMDHYKDKDCYYIDKLLDKDELLKGNNELRYYNNGKDDFELLRAELSYKVSTGAETIDTGAEAGEDKDLIPKNRFTYNKPRETINSKDLGGGGGVCGVNFWGLNQPKCPSKTFCADSDDYLCCHKEHKHLLKPGKEGTIGEKLPFYYIAPKGDVNKNKKLCYKGKYCGKGYNGKSTEHAENCLKVEISGSKGCVCCPAGYWPSENSQTCKPCGEGHAWSDTNQKCVLLENHPSYYKDFKKNWKGTCLGSWVGSSLCCVPPGNPYYKNGKYYQNEKEVDSPTGDLFDLETCEGETEEKLATYSN